MSMHGSKDDDGDDDDVDGEPTTGTCSGGARAMAAGPTAVACLARMPGLGYNKPRAPGGSGAWTVPSMLALAQHLFAQRTGAPTSL